MRRPGIDLVKMPLSSSHSLWIEAETNWWVHPKAWQICKQADIFQTLGWMTRMKFSPNTTQLKKTKHNIAKTKQTQHGTFGSSWRSFRRQLQLSHSCWRPATVSCCISSHAPPELLGSRNGSDSVPWGRLGRFRVCDSRHTRDTHENIHRQSSSGTDLLERANFARAVRRLWRRSRAVMQPLLRQRVASRTPVSSFFLLLLLHVVAAASRCRCCHLVFN